jgi:hypothetical protein
MLNYVFICDVATVTSSSENKKRVFEVVLGSYKVLLYI